MTPIDTQPPFYKQKGKKGKGGGKGGKALAYGKKPSYSVIREPLQARVMKNVFFLTEKVQGMASKGRKLTREMKEYFSGDFESMLLKATRPDDQRPPPEFIGAILDATATFHRDEDVASGRYIHRCWYIYLYLFIYPCINSPLPPTPTTATSTA